MIKCNGCAGCSNPCGKEELPSKHEMISFILNRKLDKYGLEDLSNYFYDKEYDLFDDLSMKIIIHIYKTYKEKQDERDKAVLDRG